MHITPRWLRRIVCHYCGHDNWATTYPATLRQRRCERCETTVR